MAPRFSDTLEYAEAKEDFIREMEREAGVGGRSGRGVTSLLIPSSTRARALQAGRRPPDIIRSGSYRYIRKCEERAGG
jgi:hypothetical protein